MKRIIRLDRHKHEIIEMHDNGMINYDIAKCFGVSKTSISKRLVEWGYAKPLNRIDIIKEDLCDLYCDKKLSEQKIADMHGCHRSLIHRRMMSFGIKRRSYSECRLGSSNPFYGKKHKLSSRAAMSLSYKNGRKISGSNKYGVGAYYDTPNQGRKWMRSGWERKTAVYLTENGKNWYYEYEWLYVGGAYYLPDFYLPDEDKYIEVKGFVFSKTEDKLKKAVKKFNVEIWDANILTGKGIL